MASDSISVVVKYQGVSCSGIILDSGNGIILTIGSVFSDLVRKSDKFSSLLSSKSYILWSEEENVPVEVLLERKRERENIHSLKGSLTLLWRDQKLDELAQRIFPASEWHFDHPRNNEVDVEESNKSSPGDLNHNLADFALVQVKSLSDHVSANPLDRLRLLPARQGEEVTVVGTPFGSECPDVFYNSISKGIVSNLAGSGGEILMTDARCIPGCEGCPLFLSRPLSKCDSGSLQLYGIVISPFCWRNGEWIGITLACSIKHLLSSLPDLLCPLLSQLPVSLPQEPKQLRISNTATGTSQKTANSIALQNFKERIQQNLALSLDSSIQNVQTTPLVGVTEKILPSIVLIQQGMMWGTGVVIDTSEALIVTCSHVVRTEANDSTRETINQRSSCSSQSGHTSQAKKTLDIKVHFGFPNPTCRTAEMLFATDPDCPLDFALLRIPSHVSLKAMPVRKARQLSNTKALYKKGEEVLVVGFALFPGHLKLKPSVTSGVLSNVVCVNDEAIMLQSSAAVHSGASGGALVSCQTGELLGIVTSNIKDANTSTSFPHVSFSIPATLMEQIIYLVKAGDTVSALVALISQSIPDIWSLHTKLQPLSLLSKL